DDDRNDVHPHGEKENGAGDEAEPREHEAEARQITGADRHPERRLAADVERNVAPYRVERLERAHWAAHVEGLAFPRKAENRVEGRWLLVDVAHDRARDTRPRCFRAP